MLPRRHNCCPSIVRASLRLPAYDYSSNGAYFVTICTHSRQAILVDRAKVIVDAELLALPPRFEGVHVDVSMLMPDHLHAILISKQSQAALPSVIQAFKSLTARKLKAECALERVWQRSYYDRVIRDEHELNVLREYIQNNPLVHAVRVGT